MRPCDVGPAPFSGRERENGKFMGGTRKSPAKELADFNDHIVGPIQYSRASAVPAFRTCGYILNVNERSDLRILMSRVSVRFE